MAKNPVVPTVEETIAALQANAKRKGGSRIKKRRYEIYIPTMEEIMDLSLAPQAIAIAGIIMHHVEASGTTFITEGELFNLIEGAVDQLTTTQTPWKVFQYYRKPIMEAGILKEIVADSTTL